MNILTIGTHDNITQVFNLLNTLTNAVNITHVIKKDDALSLIKERRKHWDWIIIQGHDDPGHWKSILCALNASAMNTPITVISSHIDGTRLKTPVCSMHSDGEGLSVSRCAMQNLLNEEKPPTKIKVAEGPTPIVFEYHSPCR